MNAEQPTLLDFFAAAALTGLLAKHVFADETTLARLAFDIANAMVGISRGRQAKPSKGDVEK